MSEYQVIDLLQSGDLAHCTATVEANTPEQAARIVFGGSLVRGAGRAGIRPRAKVFWADHNGRLTMVKLYSAEDEGAH